MPLPTPNSGESRDKFITRCMSLGVMNGEYPNARQRMAVCTAQWERKDTEVNEKLLEFIRERLKGIKKTEFGYGILTADKYVRTMMECVGLDACYRFAHKRNISFNDVLEKSAGTLVYSNVDMVLEEKQDSERFKLPETIELPKNTLMAFRHVLTSSRKDRDGDVLRTDGAVVDPKMLLLWQHVHTLPIGKMLGVATHDKDKLSLYSAIVDMNELCHDAAVMVDNDMARFSHGFRAVKFDKIKAEETDPEKPSPGGFDVKEFEIMEESIVSVPSNVDSTTEEVIVSLVERGKLTSEFMKEYGKALRGKMPKQVPGVDVKYSANVGNGEIELVCRSFEDLKKAHDAGLISTRNDDEDKSGSGSDASKGVGEGEAASSSTSEEADGGEGEGEGTTEDKEVKEEIEEKSEVLEGTKQGRVLSKANEGKIRDAKDDIDEAANMEVPRACKSLLRQASRTLSDVISTIKVESSGDEETEESKKPGKPESREVGVIEAMGIVLSRASTQQRITMVASLQALTSSEKRSELAKQYRTVVGIE